MRQAGLRSDQLGISREPQFLSKRGSPSMTPRCPSPFSGTVRSSRHGNSRPQTQAGLRLWRLQRGEQEMEKELKPHWLPGAPGPPGLCMQNPTVQQPQRGQNTSRTEYSML
ncbi:hypothetical protein AGOR_G00246580 [Albula goreensis]|uniref:Uncharacterized protein n=1 Tax=Albula goreensis TaxID=1534307 RepID=A0A8T3CH07_9TELE|nr:hypothetical protein AGOR_G00246580 [Albula goreensis]